jgi:hypothetical protein
MYEALLPQALSRNMSALTHMPMRYRKDTRKFLRN